MRVWQIATGEPGRDYRRLFFEHDIMILGPSHLGDASLHSYSDGVANSAGSQIHRFVNNPVPGDRVLMRFSKTVIGVGQIPEGAENQYMFDDTFRCVFGWDLCHRRRVKWAKSIKLGPLENVFKDTKQQPSFTEVHQEHILSKVQGINLEFFGSRLRKLPEIDTSIYTEEELGVELFQAGISNRNIGEILTSLRQAERLYTWYKSDASGRYPTENEVVSHIILPLFLGLGWSHQQIAVEWKNVDMAFFKTTPTIEKQCVIVLEAKGLGKPLSDILDQPMSYVQKLGLSNAKYIITTDGANLFVYKRSRNGWNSDPVGYLNVRYLQKTNILPRGTNLIDTLVMLQPSSVT